MERYGDGMDAMRAEVGSGMDAPYDEAGFRAGDVMAESMAMAAEGRIAQAFDDDGLFLGEAVR